MLIFQILWSFFVVVVVVFAPAIFFVGGYVLVQLIRGNY